MIRLQTSAPNRTDQLRLRLNALCAQGAVLPRAAWPDLVGIEEDLWRAILAAEESAPAREGVAGHPLLPVAKRWRTRLNECGRVEEGEAINGVLDHLHASRLARWRQGIQAEEQGDDPEVCFEQLRETDRLVRAAFEPTRAGVGGIEELTTGREKLRAGLLRAAPAGVATRERWADVLVETADAALAQVEDLPPAPAAAHLEGLAGELDWHTRHVETERGTRRNRLRRRRRRLRAEATERRLSARLAALFGARLVRLWERGILLAILLVISLMFVPALASLSETWERRLLWFDGILCSFFVVDFFVKWTLTRWDLVWFARHVVTDLVPALPFSLVLLAEDPSAAAGGFSVVLLRMFRLGRLAQSARILMPILRASRAIGFLLRGLDGVVRRYGRALDFDVVLHPTPEERRRARQHERSELSTLWRLESMVEGLWTRTLEHRDGPGELAAARLPVLRNVAETAWSPPKTARSDGARRADLSADELLERMASIQPEEVEGELGHELVARIAKAAHSIAGSPLRWLPLVRAYVPRAPEGISDADLVAQLTRGAAARFGGHLDRLRWGADLYGTMTPSDLVGQIGAALVKRTSRPVVRLLLIGAAYLVLVGLLSLLPVHEVAVHLSPGAEDWSGRITDFSKWLSGLFGMTLFLVAGVCGLLLLVGVWLKRLASDASAYYSQVASAQFLHLTEGIKVRRLEEDASLFAERVFTPERALREPADGTRSDREVFLASVRRWLTEGFPVERHGRGFDPVARAVLLYRDVLGGALLAETDTRTTSQLLGNLALKRIRGRSWRVSAGDDRALARLDLVHRRGWVGGPWMWFNLIAKATTQQVARLIVEYNENAIPLEELPQAAPEGAGRYRAWLASRGQAEQPPLAESGERGQVTTAFTALHFLDDAQERDEAIEARFGPQVLAALRRDRRSLFRRVFGTFPLHLRPPEQRVLNPRDVYRRWVEGGRVLFLPLRVLALALRELRRAAGLLATAVRRIRNRTSALAMDASAESDFVAAARKIDRMRGPAARACTWQRVLADVEYLGLELPGCSGEGAAPTTVEDDLEFLAAPFSFRERVEAERLRAAADVTRVQLELDRGLWEQLTEEAGVDLERTGERLRALVVAYRADYHGLRSQLSCFELCAEVLLPASLEPALAPLVQPRLRLQRAFRAWWKTYGRGGALERRRAWRAAEHDVGGVAAALKTWHRSGPEAARIQGRRALVEVLRHPGQITEQLVTLRSVQTLALIDLRNYRHQVWRLGRFEEEGDEPGRALEVPSLRTTLETP